MGFDITQVFQNFARFVSILGWLAVPVGVFLFWFGSTHQFESDNTKYKILLYAKLAALVFVGCQLPSVLVAFIAK